MAAWHLYIATLPPSPRGNISKAVHERQENMTRQNLRVKPYTYKEPNGSSQQGQAIFINHVFRVFIPNNKIVDVSNALIDNYEQGSGTKTKDK
ncbi:hypothetical protein [Rothia terrae]|uniref:Uncharacterized protein n=1 Tax=Rothia terrae TaxID=396015 RepID=A0A7H2BD02_9MICC|nr:hypothetical protein [Rothia terrae]QNV37548.1 hypothetical protein IDM49_10090 [Rothia terrae]